MATEVPHIPVLDGGVRLRERFRVEAPTWCAPPPADPLGPVNQLPLIVATLLAAGALVLVSLQHGGKPALLLALGLALGFTLFHSHFGFTSGWRQLVTVGNGQALRAQLLLLGVAATMITIVLAGQLAVFDPVTRPTAIPIGLALLIGATLFGIGMQLAGSCASGTLFAVGAGQSSIVLSLGGFVAGQTLCIWAYPAVQKLPAGPGLLLADRVGWIGSSAVTWVALLVAGGLTWHVQRKRRPPPVAPPPPARGPARLYRGTWSPTAGALVLGVLAGLVFLVSGRVWAVASAFGLWGTKLLQAVGGHPEHWAFWQLPDNARQLQAPLLTDRLTLTNLGIMIGAAVAAAAAGAWRLHTRMPARAVLAALLGGLLMGVGSRMSGGCNIGAFLGAISVGNLSGWIWGCCALAGAWLGVQARPLLGLHNPRPSDSIC